MEIPAAYGFCPHKRAIPGLDAYHCPDCKHSFERHTPTYKALVQNATKTETEGTDEIFKSWCELAYGEWGTPIPIKAIAQTMEIGLSEIRERLEVLQGSGRTDFELIPSRKSDRNLKIGDRSVADLTFYRTKLNAQELAAENRRLTEEVARLREALLASEHTIKRAKDINPVQRPSLVRVMRLVTDACMSLSRVAGGWLLYMGNRSRRFKNLYQIWDLLLADDWCLSDIFTPAAAAPLPPSPPSPPKLRPRNPSIAPSVLEPVPI